MIAEYIKDLVKGECGKAQNELGKAFYGQHILVVKEYACRLAKLLGADSEVVELSSYLHDISAVMNINTLSNHADQSSEVAELILKDQRYDPKKLELVKRVIRSHSTPLLIGEGTPEEVCVSNADAISQITNPSYWLYFAFSVRGLDFDQGMSWYQQKVRMNLEAMIPQAKSMVGEKSIILKELEVPEYE